MILSGLHLLHRHQPFQSSHCSISCCSWPDLHRPFPCWQLRLSPNRWFAKHTPPFPACTRFSEARQSSPCRCCGTYVLDHHCQACSDLSSWLPRTLGNSSLACSGPFCYSTNKQFHCPSSSSSFYGPRKRVRKLFPYTRSLRSLLHSGNWTPEAMVM